MHAILLLIISVAVVAVATMVEESQYEKRIALAYILITTVRDYKQKRY